MPKPSDLIPASTHPLRLGVVGHRFDKLTHDDIEQLRIPVDLVLTRLDRLRESGTPLNVITSLAEGTDRLLAAEALARDIPVDVFLPVGRVQFENDFSSDTSRLEYRQLLSRVRSVTEPSDAESGGYHWATERIVELSDVLVAVWDGEPGRGPGGTASAIDSALAADVPVIWLLSREPWSVDVVEPDAGMLNSSAHQLLAELSLAHAATGSPSLPLSRTKLRLY